MTILIIIGIIIFLGSIGKKKPSPPPKKNYYDPAKKQQIKVTSILVENNLKNSIKIETEPVLKVESKDDSIIDVGSQSTIIEPDYGLNSKVPYWSHAYVYSYSEINYATAQQKKFYQYFKDSFLKGEYLELEGNTNYAFILLFDLLNEFDKHKNVTQLESFVEILGNHYPKTKTYGVNFLIKKMQEVGDTEGVARLREDHYDYQYSQVSYSTFEWRNKYKKKLDLVKEETGILDKIWFSTNNFVSIEYCCIEVIKLYLQTIKRISQTYSEDDTTIENEFEEIADVIVRKHYRFRKGSNNYNYGMKTCENELYTNIFKYCENTIRELYGHKRKIKIDLYITTPEARAEFETKILNKVSEIHSELISGIALPDETTEIVLNSLNTTRWKIKFEQMTSEYNSSPSKFVQKVIELGALNKENPSVENVFFEASKFISKYDKESALTLYLHYLYHDLKSATFDNKQLTKTIQKSLFKNSEQIESFENIVSAYIENKDFEKALSSVSQVYAVKRKKIQLDKTLIKEVQEQHSGTVELLNEYLQDENEVVENKAEMINEEIEIKVVQNNEQASISIYLNDFPFKPIHTSALEIFVKNNFSMLQSEFEDFAKSKGAFKNQLIESINEMCYEILDDVLIEEDEDYYTIDNNYYQKLLA
ncbi:hypothetical protein NAT51_15455 [Flavobacterium amniphilum]|uniref:tellurite resistance TerB C-terminal domain-containing protein n=1 Tax=Flavobacterium amniphilum TaxID=1834035 RepID=UPI00202ABB9E|nr:tellurite resistance TerB C-terminal domain-containing protein [Flavobacterium amniphilum]MCL9806932.1 hypothetical protein [Flavobacterium amniphilum]